MTNNWKCPQCGVTATINLEPDVSAVDTFFLHQRRTTKRVQDIEDAFDFIREFVDDLRNQAHILQGDCNDLDVELAVLKGEVT